ncbi:MAG: glycosyltransferase family 2 protein [Clostridia bacterium]|nr:glycosyltransferase family 2 protein [Clostridia bacterium]MBQ9781456.1 glycosyltransferase family 2 protein [Clostridia bacterium]
MKLYLVIPCYNEEAVLSETSKRLRGKYDTLMSAGKISPDSRIVFVNDGSKDKTWEMICDLHKADPVFRGICLSRNKGHQNALMAGLMTVKDECDAAISMDADLQDDINAIDAMVDKYAEGYEVVYGVRSSRKKDTFFKRTTAQGFYKVMKAMGVETVYNHADYRLMSSRALNALSEFDEVNLFLRGIVPMVGFKSTEVTYERGERFAGESKYPLKKMIAFATEGITSMSIKPIRLIATLGMLVFLASIGILIYSIIRYFMNATVPGWAFLAVSIWALGGVQLLAIGVIGEYIGKIYLETKHRPKYIISQYLNDD